MIFNIMFYVGLVLFILFFIATIVIFFLLKIPKAFGVVTGQTQKKAIEEIRSGGMRPSGRRSRTKESAILARDVGGKAADTSSALKRNSKMSMKKSSESMEDIAEKARQDAKVVSEKAQEAEKQRKLAEAEESTELLTYNEYKKSTSSDAGEEATSVLEEEQATAVLSEDETADVTAETIEKVSKAARYGVSSEEESTDVLKPTISTVGGAEEDITDVLRTTAARADLYDDDLDEEIETDVLTEDMGSKLSEDEVYGVYNPEMTAVLKSDMAPNEDSIRPRRKVNLEGITVLYSETIVHTDESL